jgi:hypothetical protein
MNLHHLLRVQGLDLPETTPLFMVRGFIVAFLHDGMPLVLPVRYAA